MQAELTAEGLLIDIGILGVNRIGSESGNAENCQGRVIPWLQDEVPEDVWNEWSVTYRDVFTLNEENELHRVYNLTEHDLGDPANYDELKGILRDLASP